MTVARKANTENSGPVEPRPAPRRHDVDWLRVLALGLLIVYHVVLCFQPWAASIRFPRNEPPLEALWPFMALINIWRIPLLFLISGMGVRFAMERRDWKQLLLDRTLRIALPFVFCFYGLGSLFAVALPWLGWNADYTIQFGHLWFLVNIYCYVLWLIGILTYLKNSPDHPVLRFLGRVIRWPPGLFLLALLPVVEAALVNPEYFSLYVDTVHGWLLGLICFFLGFVFVCRQHEFWPAVARIRWIALGLAFSLYLVRLCVFQLQQEPNALVAFESMCWMLAVLGFASLHLDRPSRILGYCSRAVYPVYIVHLPVQFTAAYVLLPLALPASVKLTVLLVGTFGVSLLLYEYGLRRLKWIRPFFGMKLNRG
jgi:surface polysaccharide O-acyltransferase-like enzyme